MAITFTTEQINYLVNEVQSLALRAKMSRREITVGAIVDLINNLPEEQELTTPWYKRIVEAV